MVHPELLGFIQCLSSKHLLKKTLVLEIKDASISFTIE